jgi:hypothetical protein
MKGEGQKSGERTERKTDKNKMIKINAYLLLQRITFTRHYILQQY